MWERFGLSIMHRLDPERAHHLAIAALKTGLMPASGPVTSLRLATQVAGMEMPNPIGLAAGFDKNAEAVTPLSNAGFGFLEVGAATPLPQPGNAKPRLFRLSEDKAAINRFGFNNDGMEIIAKRLQDAPRRVPVGLNLGANKTSDNRAADFARVLSRCGSVVDFATVNVSSPNTEKLRDLQGKAALAALLAGVMEANSKLAKRIPIFLKIAPDLSGDELADVAEVAISSRIDGLIATNTTLSRDALQSAQKSEAGGLSGQPLFEKSTRILAQLSQLTEAKLPIIGVGGVANAEQAYAKIRAGACAVQLYTGLVYGGITLGGRIAQDLDALLARDGHATVAEAIGTGRSEWL